MAGRRTRVDAIMSRKRLAPVFVGHDIYRRAAYGSNHPLAIPRVESVVDLCRVLEWLDDVEFCRARVPAKNSSSGSTRRSMCTHCARRRAPARSISRQDSASHRDDGEPVVPGVFERAATSVGGSIRAAELA
jgi:acetoin utilization protein AcuC